LLPLHGGPAIEIVQDLTVLGRQEGCDVSLKFANVSRVHCAIVRANGRILLRDLGSRNGTHVNGARVHEVVLRNGDQFGIVGHLFHVFVEEEPDPPPQDGASSHRLN
jgi:pSer/pThr/pTyr-binding forkhead associated (FHA) protein